MDEGSGVRSLRDCFIVIPSGVPEGCGVEGSGLKARGQKAREMDFSLAFCLCNMLMGMLSVVLGVSKFFGNC